MSLWSDAICGQRASPLCKPPPPCLIYSPRVAPLPSPPSRPSEVQVVHPVTRVLTLTDICGQQQQ